ncbi:MAG: hypothetical protein WKG06_13360 [Segetibacter sp.]
MELLLNVVSLCIFPFVARPMIQLVTGMDRTQFNAMMEQRKKKFQGLLLIQ